MGTDIDWRLRAACRDAPDPDLWFSDDPAEAEQAAAICSGCPVQEPCRDVAASDRETVGIWAGRLLTGIPRTRTDRNRSKREQYNRVLLHAYRGRDLRQCTECAVRYPERSLGLHHRQNHPQVDHLLVVQAGSNMCAACWQGTEADAHQAHARETHQFAPYPVPTWSTKTRCVHCRKAAGSKIHGV